MTEQSKPTATESRSHPWFKKRWVAVVASLTPVLAVALILGLPVALEDDFEDLGGKPPSATSSERAEAVEEYEASGEQLTDGQIFALVESEVWLYGIDFQGDDSADAFDESTGGNSRWGLIDLLVEGGHSKSDATFAADRISPDWNQQAARAAKFYSFVGGARSEWVDQLEKDGFTPGQQDYAVDYMKTAEPTAYGAEVVPGV